MDVSGDHPFVPGGHGQRDLILQRSDESVREKEGTLYRKYCCVGNSMGDPAQAKDVRMFAMNSWLINRRNGIVRKMKELEMWIRKRVSMVEKLRFVTAFIRDMAAYVFLVYQVTMGAITLSEFVLLFGAVTGFSAFVESLVDNWMMLRKGKRRHEPCEDLPGTAG